MPPTCLWLWLWWWPSIGSDGNLHAGVMMGNDRKTERKTRTTLGLCFLFWEGWTREIVFWGDGGEVEESEECGDADADLGSPIGRYSRTGKRRSVPSGKREEGYKRLRIERTCDSCPMFCSDFLRLKMVLRTLNCL